MAILAGDSLLTEAFYMMANSLSNRNIKRHGIDKGNKRDCLHSRHSWNGRGPGAGSALGECRA